ncbi:malate dehydrogenase [Gammaproteobacteria bacterium]|nr:malate dehydrogenase [Gammaproteobacteria bacterium]
MRVAITGAAGQIGYHLAYAVARGEVFLDQRVTLVLVDLPSTINAMQGVKMEIEDGAMSAVASVEVRTTDELTDAFEGLDFIFLVGAFPRQKGMERRDLLEKNAQIFIETGQALSKANPSCQVLVVGNPCNSNCLIVSKHARHLPKEQFFAMTMLDQNRAEFQLAKKAGVGVSDITDMYIYGNHSATQFPDFYHAKVKQVQANLVLDESWLKAVFLKTVQQRGAEVIKKRGASSAASAARAASQTAALIFNKSQEPFSVAMISDGAYDSPAGLVVSMPYHFQDGRFTPVLGLKHNDHAKHCMQRSYQELIDEYEQLKTLGVL